MEEEEGIDAFLLLPVDTVVNSYKDDRPKWPRLLECPFGRVGDNVAADDDNTTVSFSGSSAMHLE